MHQALNALQALRLSPQTCVVEIGSGAGWIARLLAGLAYRVECIEPSATMVEVARQNVAEFLRWHDIEDVTKCAMSSDNVGRMRASRWDRRRNALFRVIPPSC